MLVHTIETRQFRNLQHQTVETGRRFNVLSGANAQGKTNFLEAVYLVACLKSFRGHRSAAMVQLGHEDALVRATVEAGQLHREQEVRLHQGGRRALVDGKGVRGTTSYLEGGLNVVLFTPDDVQLPRGSPAERRRLVDRAITNLWPAYLGLSREYLKTLQSRNRVLRDLARGGQRSQLQAMLEVYDQQLGEKGARVVAARLRYLSGLGRSFEQVFRDISRSGVAGTLHYLSPEPMLEAAAGGVGSLAEVLQQELRRAWRVDRARQSTTQGPHTHDVEFRLDGHSTRSMGSQGQHRALVLSFKVAQVLDVQEKLEDSPVMLLDDVSSELDALRTKYLFDFISKMSCQAFLTTTRADLVVLDENRVDFQVVNGSIRAVD